jgi:hypothetical protein
VENFVVAARRNKPANKSHNAEREPEAEQKDLRRESGQIAPKDKKESGSHGNPFIENQLALMAASRILVLGGLR